MAEQITYRYGGYENLSLSQAEIAARAYDAGMPPSVRPINAFNSIVWIPCRVMIAGVPTEYGVALDVNNVVLWRNINGGVNTAGSVNLGHKIFALPGSLGVGFYNPTTGSTLICYDANTFLTLPSGSGKYLMSQAIEFQ